MHLAGNMLFLWIYGDNVQYRLGAPRASSSRTSRPASRRSALLHAAGDWGDRPSRWWAASGAISSGVLGFYFVLVPAQPSYACWWLLPPFVMQVFEVPARLALGIYLIL